MKMSRHVKVLGLLLGASLFGGSCKGVQTIGERARQAHQEPIQLPEPIILPEEPLTTTPPEELQARVRIGDDQVRSFELRGLPLANAIHLIAETAGVNIYLNAALDTPVDASFPAVTLDDALDVLLKQNQLRLVEEPKGVFWIRNDDGTEHETASFRVQSIDVESIESDLASLVAEDATLVVNAEQNFVLVDGTSRDVQLVAEYLSGVDRLKRQVLLEVEIVELLLSDDFQVGLSMGFSNAEVGNELGLVSLAQNLTSGNGEFSISLDDPNTSLEATLTALQKYVGVNVVSSPRVLAVTKSPAKVEVITEIPYIQATVSTDVSGGTAASSTAQQVEFKEVGIVMEVTPTIQEGGAVEIRIEQTFSNVIDFFQTIPVVDQRTLSTVMLVQDGHTVVIGGLQQESVLEDDTGVPFLMDLPLLGRLFRSDSDSTQKRQLLVFVTPRILGSRQAAELSNELKYEYSEKRRLSGMTSVAER